MISSVASGMVLAYGFKHLLIRAFTHPESVIWVVFHLTRRKLGCYDKARYAKWESALFDNRCAFYEPSDNLCSRFPRPVHGLCAWKLLLPRSVRRSRVIGDFGGYRRLIVDFALFGREGLARKGSC